MILCFYTDFGHRIIIIRNIWIFTGIIFTRLQSSPPNMHCTGGSFALYSLLCRYCNISLLPNQHPTDVELTTYLVDHANQKTYLQRKLEGSPSLQKVLLLIVLLGTCMVIGDGILTPSISGKQLFVQSLIHSFAIIGHPHMPAQSSVP